MVGGDVWIGARVMSMLEKVLSWVRVQSYPGMYPIMRLLREIPPG